MKNLLLLMLLCVIYVPSEARAKENQPSWVEESYRRLNFPQNQYYTEFRIIEGVRRSMRSDAEEDLNNQLKKALAQYIYSNIKSEENLWQSELVFLEQISLVERFISDVTIESDIELLNSRSQLYYNKKSKQLFGFIYIEKRQLAQHYNNLMQKDLTLLKAQLLANDVDYASNSQLQRTIKAYEERFDKINGYSTVMISCGQMLEDNQINEIAKVRTRIDELYQYLDMAEFDEKLRIAQESILYKNYERAYQQFLQLSLTQPDNAKVRAGLREAKTGLETFYMTQIASKIQRKEYHQAIVYYNSLFTLLPLMRENHREIYKEIEIKAFDQNAKQLKDAIRSDNIMEMRRLIVVLDNYRHVNETNYQRLKTQVERGEAFELYQSARLDYYDSRYASSIGKLKRALVLDEGDYTYKNLLNKAQNKIYEQKLHNLKMTRPNTYCFQIGAGAQNNFNAFDKYLNTENFTSSLMGVYSAGIYRKFQIKDRVRGNGRDRSRSRIVGFRYSYINRRNVQNIDIGTNLVDGLQELEFVYGIRSGINLALGVVSEDLHYQVFDRSRFYTATISKRIYLLPIELSLDLKGYITEDNLYPVLKLSGLINMNFNRQISHKDRKKLRQEVESEY